MLARVILLCGIGAAALVTAPQAQALDQDNGRLLSSNCMACHATNGQPKRGGYTSLVGKSYSYILLGLNRYANRVTPQTSECRTANSNACLMGVHSRPYSSSDLQDIAWYLSRR